MAKNIIGDEYVGGIVGYSGAQIENCSNHTLEDPSGVVSGKNYVGGLVGLNYVMGNITDCFNAGGIIVEKDNCGGIVGLNNANISNCYNVGEIDALSADGVKIGGICGQNISESYIYSSYSIGKIKVKATGGGIVGANFGTTSNCFYSKDSISNQNQDNDEAKTDEEMKSSIISSLGESYREDTTNVNSGYPMLTWQEN